MNRKQLPRRVKDVRGVKFGILEVLEFAGVSRNKSRSCRWLAVCDCGNFCTVPAPYLRTSPNPSCGCAAFNAKSVATTRKNFKHGYSHRGSPSKVYNTYHNMMKRCSAGAFGKDLKNYYERGIAVCDSWSREGGFTNFIRDMGEPPSKNSTIERLDLNKGYCPENCVWLELELQARNRGMQENNTSGYTGVYHQKPSRGFGLGSWVADWRDLDGVRHTKSFSIIKYGEDEAKLLAVDFRRQVIESLNQHGAGYSDSHGKPRINLKEDV